MDPKRRVFERGSVAIDGDKIAAVGKDVKEKADTVIDARGKVVLPGLVNAHTHLPMTLLRGVADDMPLKPWLEDEIWPAEANLTAEHVNTGALLGCLEMIISGTTCFADQYFFMEEVAKAVEESGIRAALSYGIIEKYDPRLRKDEIKKGTELIRNYHGAAGGRIITMYGPHAPYTCSEECLVEVKELAKKYDVGIHIHLSETIKGDVEVVEKRYGKKPFIYLEEIGFLGPEILAAHCVHLTDEEIKLVKKNDVKIAHNPVSNMKLASGIAPVAKYLKDGIVVAIGTDGCASNNNLDMFEEMKVCSLVHKIRESDPTVVNAGEVLAMATIGGARALRWDKEIGSIEVGKKADLILVDLKKPHLTPVHNVVSNLVYSANGGDVDTVLVDGKIVMRERKVLTLDEEEILQRAQEAAGDLINKRKSGGMIERARAAAEKTIKFTKWCKSNPERCLLVASAAASLLVNVINLLKVPFGAGVGVSKAISIELEKIHKETGVPINVLEKALDAACQEAQKK